MKLSKREENLKEALKQNRSNANKGHGEKYWDSVVEVVRGFYSQKEHKGWTYTFDGESRAAYITITDGGVSETIEISDTIKVDVDTNGAIIGIELLSTGK